MTTPVSGPFCAKCGKVMTPADSKIHPEYFLHDACLPDELRPKPDPTPTLAVRTAEMPDLAALAALAAECKRFPRSHNRPAQELIEACAPALEWAAKRITDLDAERDAALSRAEALVENARVRFEALVAEAERQVLQHHPNIAVLVDHARQGRNTFAALAAHNAGRAKEACPRCYGRGWIANDAGGQSDPLTLPCPVCSGRAKGEGT